MLSLTSFFLRDSLSWCFSSSFCGRESPLDTPAAHQGGGCSLNIDTIGDARGFQENIRRNSG